MLKKVFLFFVLLFFSWNVFADEIDDVEAENQAIMDRSNEIVETKNKLSDNVDSAEESLTNARFDYEDAVDDLNGLSNDSTELERANAERRVAEAELDIAKAQQEYDKAKAYRDWEVNLNQFDNEDSIESTRDNLRQAQEKYDKARDDACAKSWDCIDKPTFVIPVDSFTPWWNSLKDKDSTAKNIIDNVLLKIIENLIVAFWVLALLIMTIGWWFMIIYYGQDELLSKWKNIFSSWLIALLVALGSWLIVRLVSYLLYGN